MTTTPQSAIRNPQSETASPHAQSLPLLLTRHRVSEMLGLPSPLVHELRAGGELRVWHPDPSDGFAYYLTVDALRVTGRSLDLTWTLTLPPKLLPREFCRCSGLTYYSLLQALRHGVIEPWDGGGHRRFYRETLWQWCR